jgi:ABC-type transport system involved in cytochrome c biogenesis permease subunit
VAVGVLQWAAAIYLIACLVAASGLVLRSRRLALAAVWLLAAGAVLHGVSFPLLHAQGQAPPLTSLAAASSFMAWIGTLCFLGLLLRVRIAGLVVLVAPAAFLGVFLAALRLPAVGPATFAGSGSWPHAHVLLASAGVALLGLSGLASLVYLLEHHRLKAKSGGRHPLALPSLEALDRVNATALAAGFTLLTLGIVTGMFWVQAASGRLFVGSPHEAWTLVAWAVYAVLAAVRFAGHQGARQAAAAAVVAFGFLFFAVIGVELLA